MTERFFRLWTDTSSKVVLPASMRYERYCSKADAYKAALDFVKPYNNKLIDVVINISMVEDCDETSVCTVYNIKAKKSSYETRISALNIAETKFCEKYDIMYIMKFLHEGMFDCPLKKMFYFALKAEYHSLKAKRMQNEEGDYIKANQEYTKKNNALEKLIKAVYKYNVNNPDNMVLYGIGVDETLLKNNGVLYFNLPNCGQISYHSTVKRDLKLMLPKYSYKWNNANHTLTRIENGIVRNFHEELEIKNTLSTVQAIEEDAFEDIKSMIAINNMSVTEKEYFNHGLCGMGYNELMARLNKISENATTAFEKSAQVMKILLTYEYMNIMTDIRATIEKNIVKLINKLPNAYRTMQEDLAGTYSIYTKKVHAGEYKKYQYVCQLLNGEKVVLYANSQLLNETNTDVVQRGSEMYTPTNKNILIIEDYIKKFLL